VLSEFSTIAVLSVLIIFFTEGLCLYIICVLCHDGFLGNCPSIPCVVCFRNANPVAGLMSAVESPLELVLMITLRFQDLSDRAVRVSC
jgi:hypothetical protein